MGYDLVTWNPAVGGSGVDQWDVPAEAKWAAGDPLLYSATPTIPEINAGTDFNQIVALTRRRILTYNAAFGTSMAVPTYVSNAGTERINVAALTTLRSAINTLRTAERFAAFSWSAITAGTSLNWTRYIGELRRALRIAGTWSRVPILSNYSRILSPYPTPLNEFLNSGGASNLGITLAYYPSTIPPTNSWTGYRGLGSFALPEWVAGYNGTVALTGAAYTSLAPFSLALYASNTDDHVPSLAPAYGGSAYNINVLLQTIPGAASGSSTYTFTIPAGALAARAGSYLSLIVGTVDELVGACPIPPGSGAWGSYINGGAFGNLTVDFGA